MAEFFSFGTNDLTQSLFSFFSEDVEDKFPPFYNETQILQDNPRMTATEVIERTREKGILLAPTVGRQQSEYLGPLVDREIDVLVEQGLLPPMPDV